MNPIEHRKVKCPECGTFTFYSLQNPFRPFCSERCRVLDLGSWAEEKYRVPTQTHADFAHPENESKTEE